MSVVDRLLGRPLRSRDEGAQQIGAGKGIAVLGLDALASAAYGPEAALTRLMPLGAVGLAFIVPISFVIVAILIVVYASYRQTISAYPNGGGSYTVARENLGHRAGLLAATALALDYVLNVAVGISTGIGALVSAVPSLLPHTLPLTLGVLALLTIVNLRGIKEAGTALAVPTYVFVAAITGVIVVGAARAFASGGAPVPLEAPPRIPHAVEAAGAWLVLHAFASGCTAMTGVEAVSNAVPIFRKPRVPVAERTLTAIIAILIAFLIGIAYLCHAYGITATEPGRPGYQSVLSMVTAAVLGRGPLYYVTIASIVAVTCLSANTSFAGFPRLLRLLALEGHLPDVFAERGRRLVFSAGIVVLASLAAILLLAFGGVTDALIPLFAVGAFLAFTLSQAGMVVHWRRHPGPGARRKTIVNLTGAIATGATLAIILVAKFTNGAWITVIAVPALMIFFERMHHHYAGVHDELATGEPLELPPREPPVVVLAADAWNKMTQHALALGLGLSDDVYVVQVRTETTPIAALSASWPALITRPARAAHLPEPKLVVLTSEYREFYRPFVDFVRELEDRYPGRTIACVIPELVTQSWGETALHNNRARLLRMLLRGRCGDRVVIVSTPFHLHS
jgi:amino acid transporter